MEATLRSNQLSCRAILMSVSLLGMLCLQPLEAQTDIPKPDGWSGERITLPPGFAPDMKLQGVEEIRFAPGMFKPQSDSFFSYAFIFEAAAETKFTDEFIKEQMLAYYRGLGKAVLGGAEVELPPAEFRFELKAQKEKGPRDSAAYRGVLKWTEPFRTKKQQTLSMELHAWQTDKHSYLFVCASPQKEEAAIWKELRKLRDDYFKESTK